MSNRKENAKANAQAAVGGNNIETDPDKKDMENKADIDISKVAPATPDIVDNIDEEEDKTNSSEEVNNKNQTNQEEDETERFPRQNTVLVSLKHPQGIVFTTPDNRKVLINGNATHLKGLKKGALPTGGFGLTTVSQADWEYIKKTYGGMNVFKNGLIFAQNDYASAMDMQKDNDGIKSGMEPVSVGAESPVEALKKVGKAPIKDS